VCVCVYSHWNSIIYTIHAGAHSRWNGTTNDAQTMNTYFNKTILVKMFTRL